MTPQSTPLVETYRNAVQGNDPARASEAWRAAQSPDKEFERNAMIQILDFSVVESYSFAQASGDLNAMSAIWSKALHSPDTALARFLNTLSMRDLELEPPPKESKEEAKECNKQVQSFLNELLSRPLAAKPGIPQDSQPSPSQQGVCVTDLLAFAQDPVRRSVCGLTPTDIEVLKGLGRVLLPAADTTGALKQWAADRRLGLTDSQIEKVRKASLLLQNQMAPADANMLAMAARSAKGKKGKEANAPNSPQKDTAPPTNLGSLPE